MAEEEKEVQAPKPEEAPTQKLKLKSAKAKLRLTGAGSLNYDGLVYRKGEVIEAEASQAEQLMKSGLFERL